MSETVLEARKVNKKLGSGAGEVHAIKDIDLTLCGGELTMLMGPSGSGKTTLLSVLGCMLTPTSGTVLICGKSIEGASKEALAALRRQHIGFIFQSYHLFPTMTAAENVQLALDVRGERGAQARKRAEEALARVGLAHKVSSYPTQLSGGEQQRVAIARAIVSDPSAILADEPTAALDSNNGQAIMSILASIAKDPSRGVLVVTHDSRLTSYADRIIFIEDGRLVREERRRSKRDRPRAAAIRGRGS
ncbi:MAG TPA: ABC transporter ATP-binding protein [Pseudolabrys sp.]|jgi:putative ABC transport system ATP-binding protein|nr:ABC transporter ATP-binding protein [Pseudolabrys sp.]